MTRSRPRSRFTVALAALALSVLLAGCGVFGAASAASVNGSSITDGELQDELEAIRDNGQYRQALEAGFGGSLQGASEGTFDAVFAARVLTLQIYYELASQFLDDEGIDIDDARLGAARQDAVEQAGGSDVFSQFPESYQDTVVRRHAIVVSLGERLVEDFYEANADQFTQLCASHILVETEQEAAQLRARIEQGEDFAAVAQAESIDSGSAQQGGDLGCQPGGTFVAEFEDAAADLAPGELSQPIETPFGFHLVLVQERRTLPLSEVRPQVEQGAVNEWLAQAAADADIDVNPRYGTWSSRDAGGTEVFEVVPPEGPSTTGAGPDVQIEQQPPPEG